MIHVDPPTDHPREAIQPAARRHGTRWCHLWPDNIEDPAQIEELHRLAAAIGLRRAWFQDKPRFPHYDLVAGKYRRALAAGAVSTPLRDWLLRHWLSRKAAPSFIA